MIRPGQAEIERVLLNTLTEIFVLEMLRRAGEPLTTRQVSRRAGLLIYEAEAMLQALCRERVAERAPDLGRAWRYQAKPRPAVATGDSTNGQRGMNEKVAGT